MAALVFCVCGALYDLYDFSDAYKRCNCDYRRTVTYLSHKKRVLLFRQYCREFHVNHKKSGAISNVAVVGDSVANATAIIETKSAKFLKESDLENQIKDEVDNIVTLKPTVIMNKRAGIDFAAIEASAEAFEVIDSFAVVKPRSITEDFLEVERENCDFRESYFFDDDEIEIIEGVEDDTILYQDAEDEIVYHNSSLGLLQEGVSFSVSGKTKRHCERFSINFIIENESRDIALHINPRLPQNFMVRNSKVRNVWGREEVASALPFTLRRGMPFSVQILFTEINFMISVNGYHFCKFYHRLPYMSIQTLEVKGEIEDVAVERRIVKYYPERLPESVPKQVYLDRSLASPDHLYDKSLEVEEGPDHKMVVNLGCATASISRPELKLPYYGTIPINSFQIGRVLKISGRVRLLPHSFYINLQSGYNCWPHPGIALHLNPRFTKQSSGCIGRATVIRNSWLDGEWGQEEKSDLETTFRPGKTFILSIVHGHDSFEIYVDDQMLTEYKFRVDPSTIDTIYIQGDIKLFGVSLEINTTFVRLLNVNHRSETSSA